MAAKKRATRKKANSRSVAYRGKGIVPTVAQKRNVKESLGVIQRSVKDIELKIHKVLNALIEMDFEDS